MKQTGLIIVISACIISAQWGRPPASWGDFQMGLVNNDRVEWDTPMKAALNAGFIGMLAGCANQGKGTVATIEQNAGDGGWFYSRLEEFDKERPFDMNIINTDAQYYPFKGAGKSGRVQGMIRGDKLYVSTPVHGNYHLSLHDMSGRTVTNTYTDGSGSNVPSGVYILSIKCKGTVWNSKVNVAR